MKRREFVLSSGTVLAAAAVGRTAQAGDITRSSTSGTGALAQASDRTTASAGRDPGRVDTHAKSVTIREVVIGAGTPKIIVPITATSAADAQQAASKIADAAEVTMAEFRIDFQDQAFDAQAMAALTRTLSSALKGKPLLATFRTHSEGGQKEIAPEQYAALYEAILASGTIDLLDVQMMLPEPIVRRLVASAHQKQVAVLMSNHDFHATPPTGEIIARLRRQQHLGADILKIAVMPKDASDTLRLMTATWEVYSRHANRPLLTMSMGGAGALSRLSGELTGSALTFGKLGASSAPGQIDATHLQTAMQILHDAVTAHD